MFSSGPPRRPNLLSGRARNSVLALAPSLCQRLQFSLSVLFVQFAPGFDASARRDQHRNARTCDLTVNQLFTKWWKSYWFYPALDFWMIFTWFFAQNLPITSSHAFTIFQKFIINLCKAIFSVFGHFYPFSTTPTVVTTSLLKGGLS